MTTGPDEPEKPAWAMPDPVFRSSEGRTVDMSDDPTESAATPAASAGDEDTSAASHQSVRTKFERPVRHKDKKRKGFWERNAGTLIVGGGLLVGALLFIAYLYFYQSKR